MPKRPNNDPHTLFVLAFSGGGTRAAAFSYGVLEELRRTEVVIDGQRRRLIDEVDLITGVSGGSFTALAYALYGERLFSEYEQRFLKRDVQGDLIARAAQPVLLARSTSAAAPGAPSSPPSTTTRSCSKARRTPTCSAGRRRSRSPTGPTSRPARGFSFYQNDFDLLCSDLNKVRLSRAAATSSAVPVVLSPVTFNNYGGTCGYEYPAWVADVAKPEGRVRPSGARAAALPRDAGLPEQQGSPVHPPGRRRCGGQHRHAHRAGGLRGAGGECCVPRRHRASAASAGSCSSS